MPYLSNYILMVVLAFFGAGLAQAGRDTDAAICVVGVVLTCAWTVARILRDPDLKSD